MSDFLDNIKLIASDLANMSPKTQLEIVKLCKNLCLNVKDYLVELDETTLENITTRLDNLEDEMTTAEGNIQANANAIDTINDAIDTINDTIDTINTALNNRYTKTEIDALLANKLNIQTITLSGNSGTLTEEQLADVINEQNIIIKHSSILYYKISETNINIVFGYTNNRVITQNEVIGLTASTITITKSSGAWTLSSMNNNVYTNTKVVNLLNEKQATLVSGTNIKTINNESILGSGNINISGGGDTLYTYQFMILMSDATMNNDYEVFVYLKSEIDFATQPTFSQFRQMIINNGGYVQCFSKCLTGDGPDNITFIECNSTNANVEFRKPNGYSAFKSISSFSSVTIEQFKKITY